MFKPQINKGVSLRRKRIKTFFQDVAKKSIVTNKFFWKFVRPFLTNKNYHTQDYIMLIDNGMVIAEEHDFVEIFNDH